MRPSLRVALWLLGPSGVMGCSSGEPSEIRNIETSPARAMSTSATTRIRFQPGLEIRRSASWRQEGHIEVKSVAGAAAGDFVCSAEQVRRATLLAESGGVWGTQIVFERATRTCELSNVVNGSALRAVPARSFEETEPIEGRTFLVGPRADGEATFRELGGEPVSSSMGLPALRSSSVHGVDVLLSRSAPRASLTGALSRNLGALVYDETRGLLQAHIINQHDVAARLGPSHEVSDGRIQYAFVLDTKDDVPGGSAGFSGSGTVLFRSDDFPESFALQGRYSTVAAGMSYEQRSHGKVEVRVSWSYRPPKAGDHRAGDGTGAADAPQQ